MLSWRPGALQDLIDISDFLDQIDPAFSQRKLLEIRDKATYLHYTPSAGVAVPGLPPRQYKLGYTAKADYKLWYKITAPGDIAIVMVRSSRQLPPTA